MCLGLHLAKSRKIVYLFLQYIRLKDEDCCVEVLRCVPGAAPGYPGGAAGGDEEPGRGEHRDVGSRFRAVQGHKINCQKIIC